MNNLDTATTREITRQVAGLTATELGEGWAVDTSPAFAEHRAVYLDGPDGQRLSLALDWKNADRVEIHGVYPTPEGHSLPYGTTIHQIGVGRDRGPRVMAREITRRLLPNYVAELADVLKHSAAQGESHAARVEVLDTLAEILPASRVDAGSPKDGSARLSYSGAVGYGNVEINHAGDFARMTLNSVPVHLAAKIAELIAGAETE